MRLNVLPLLFLLSYFLFLGFILTGCDSLPFSALRDGQNKNWSVGTLSQFKTDISGFVDSSLLGNYQAVSVDTDKKELLISLPAPNLFQNWEKDIPNLSGATLKAQVSSNDRSSLLLRYPLYLLVANYEKLGGGKSGLPNGQAIPGIPGGKLYSQKINIDKNHEAFVMFDKGVVSLLLNVPYDPMIPTSIPVKKSLMGSGLENLLGYAITIPKGGGTFGGLMLSIVVPPKILKNLEQ